MSIRNIHNPWRDRYQPASFRGAIFHVDTNALTSGRRVANHLYPKRNDPYAEDMGRAQRNFFITGYLIGPNYLQARDALISALEGDGPATLRLPLPYQGQDITVMAGPFTMNESKDRGGFCVFEMQFFERGVPGNQIATTSSITVGSAAQSVVDVANSFMNGITDSIGVPLG